MNQANNQPGKRTGSHRKQVTINLDEEVIEYFKKESKATSLPYQTLINLYLLDCVQKNKKPNIIWE